MQPFFKTFFFRCFNSLARSGGDIKNKHHRKTNSFKYVSNTLIFVCSHPNITANSCQTFHPQFNDPHRVANNIKPSRSHHLLFKLGINSFLHTIAFHRKHRQKWVEVNFFSKLFCGIRHNKYPTSLYCRRFN